MAGIGGDIPPVMRIPKVVQSDSRKQAPNSSFNISSEPFITSKMGLKLAEKLDENAPLQRSGGFIHDQLRKPKPVETAHQAGALS